MNRYKVVALVVVASVLGVGASETISDAGAQRADIPQRVAPTDSMPVPQGPIATWTMNVGKETIGRVQVDIVGLCRAAVEQGPVK